MIEEKLDAIVAMVINLKSELTSNKTLKHAPKKRVPLYKNEAAIESMVQTIIKENDERLLKTPTKKQIYHEQMVAALRRRRFKDFEAALKDPEMIELIKEVQKVSPGWLPKFRE